MIQRIQTVYFLIAALLVATTLFGTDLFSFDQGEYVHSTAYKLFRGSDLEGKKVDFWMLSLVQIIFALMIIFSFKMRHRQIFLGWILLVLNILSSVWIVLGANVHSVECSTCDQTATNLSFGVVFFLHAAAFIFVFLGIRGVRKDKKMIDSLNRLR
jgi:lysylphosphatidylglycerol synthetase-like protein (DUF2156 family)